MSDPERQIHLRLPSNFEALELVEQVLEKLMTRFGFQADDLFSAQLATRETMANAIQHGNRQDPEKTVRVDLVFGSEVLQIVVKDQGQGFDLAQLPDPLDPENLLKPSGRGILLMRKLTDDVRFSFPPSGGTEVCLTLRTDSIADTGVESQE